jgi:hypothetical protein
VVNLQVREGEPSSPSGVEVKNEWNCTSAPPPLSAVMARTWTTLSFMCTAKAFDGIVFLLYDEIPVVRRTRPKLFLKGFTVL